MYRSRSKSRGCPLQSGRAERRRFVSGVHASQHLMQEVVVTHAQLRQRVLRTRAKMSGEAGLLEVREERRVIRATKHERGSAETWKKARQRSVSHSRSKSVRCSSMEVAGEQRSIRERGWTRS